MLYLYLFSFVGLLITVIGCIRLVDLGLKAYIFKEADNFYYARPITIAEKTASNEAELDDTFRFEQEQSIKVNRHRELAGALSMIIVGIPLYIYHWSIIKKEKK